MSIETGAGLGAEFAAANDEAMTFAHACSDTQWQIIVPGEGWSVGVVLHHIAEGHASVMRWLEAMARGDAVTDTVDDIDTRNVEHAERASDIGIAATVELLRRNGARTEAALRSLTDEQLVRTAPFGPADGQSLPVAAMAAAASRHTREHLAHARLAVEESA
jgi:uncharacterized damage-inducible protein DinB